MTTCLSSVHAMIYPSIFITDGLLNDLLNKFLGYLRYLFTFTHFQSVTLVPYCIIVASCYQLLCGNYFQFSAVEFYIIILIDLKKNNTAEVFIVILVDACNNLEIFDILTIFSYLFRNHGIFLHVFKSSFYVC